MKLSDTLSRLYLQETSETLVPEVEVNEVSLLSFLPVSPEKQKQFKDGTKQDPVLKMLQDVVLDGWPEEKQQLASELRIYWTYKDEISSVN